MDVDSQLISCHEGSTKTTEVVNIDNNAASEIIDKIFPLKIDDSDIGVEKESEPFDDIIDHLAHNNEVTFKSQQIGEADLNIQEKKRIALDLYKKGKSLFLTKFGSYLTHNHLLYFEKSANEEYEVKIIVSQLQKILHDKDKKVLTKNRRFEALNKMLKENAYFSESEMMRRNPLLYEHLVGQYLSEKEKLDRDNIDTANITLLNVLLEGMDRRRIKDILDKQLDDEDSSSERKETSSSSDSESSDDQFERAQASNWGEFEKKPNVPTKRVKPIKKRNKVEIPVATTFISASERALLREEFVQEMYRSFLAGEDEIDYEPIDSNTDLDCLDVRAMDEEEKYFDSETPQESEMPSPTTSVTNEPNGKADENIADSEDELDVYMKHLNNHPTLKNIISDNQI